MRMYQLSAMLFRGASRCLQNVSRASASNLLRNVGSSQKSGLRKVCSLSGTMHSKLLRGTLGTNPSLSAAQEKYGKRFAKNLCSVAVACNNLNAPQVLVGLLVEAGIGTSSLQEDDEEMSSVTGKEKHRRKQCY
ncbi:uncharacterized protein LOC116604576 [Nematostella vectensis]|uniref:uncharacterized protein LOC116604576 n=1 Tax=Nematostella vectensis TaxID=45351 RepID=UPI00138FA72C|nr:uncharacterized protein LOC116604576 [Nematostella vectensis]